MSVEQIARQILIGEIDPHEEQLVEVLSAASDQYHNDGESFISDAEYDILEQMLRGLNEQNPFLAAVGSDVRGGKVPLPYAMGSLDQVYEGDTEKWVSSNDWLDEQFVVSDKQDGTSGMIVYGKGGVLQIAYSRGNGTEGADITRHVKKMKCVPAKMPFPCAVRVEFIINETAFKLMCLKAAAALERVYKNARNYVAGRMNASESPPEFYQNIQVIATSLQDPKMGKKAQFEFLEENGFEITPYIVKSGRDLTEGFLVGYLGGRRQLSPTAIDGVVIDLDDSDVRASLRRKSSSLNPIYSKKFKIGDESNRAVVKVVQVHWEPSKAGYLKPRVEIEPVDLVGVTITYATGFNAKFIRDNLIGPGARIQITRSGDVIPFIQSVIEPAATPQLPEESVFGEMGWTPGEVDLYLLDAESNDTVKLNRLIDVFKQLEVPFLREGSIEKLYQAGFTEAASIIKADQATLQRIVGDSAGVKIFEGLKAKLNPVPLGILAGSSQLMGRGIGRRKMTRLLEALGEDLDLLTVETISKVEGFEARTAKVIMHNLPKFQAFLTEITGYYTLAIPVAKPTGGDLEGIVAVFTGIRDKDLEEKIVSRSGTIGSSVNKFTTHLVCKDPSSGSGKMQKARDLGVSVIGIVEARELWG